MYCSNCGAESTFASNYCKRCGGTLTDSAQPAPQPAKNTVVAVLLTLATVALVLGGLGIVFSEALWLVHPQAPGLVQPPHADAIAGMIIAFGSATIVLVTTMLIRLFSRLMGVGPSAPKSVRPVNAFAPLARPAEITAPPIVMQSVTEHTTRNFEPLVRQRDTNQ
jgi:hypothetical protein